MILRVAKVQVYSAVITAHNALLSTTNAKYPYTENGDGFYRSRKGDS